jgi:hypothetical protein
MRHVYNLTVEGEHCFYANGILTHNCDAFVQGMRHLRDCGLARRSDEMIAEIERAKVHIGAPPEPLYPV